VPDSLLGWGLLVLGLLSLGAVFPPYEAYVRRDWWPEYQPQFFVACAALLGLVVVLVLPEEVTDVLQLLIAAVAGVYTFWLVFALWSAVAYELLHIPWTLGYGWALTLMGFLGLALAGASRVFGPKS
jgi:hypothetical protein